MRALLLSDAAIAVGRLAAAKEASDEASLQAFDEGALGLPVGRSAEARERSASLVQGLGHSPRALAIGCGPKVAQSSAPRRSRRLPRWGCLPSRL